MDTDFGHARLSSEWVNKQLATPVKKFVWFSDPATALAARRVRHGSHPTSSATLAFARYKDALVPRRFSNNSLPPFPPHSLLSCTAPPGPPSGRASLHLIPTAPLSPQNRYDAARRKNAAARPAGSYSLVALVVLSPRPSDPCVDPCTMTLGKRLAFR